MAAAALRALGSRMRMNASAAAKVAMFKTTEAMFPETFPFKRPEMLSQISRCPTTLRRSSIERSAASSKASTSMIKFKDHFAKRKVNHAVGSSSKGPPSSVVFNEQLDKIVQELWQSGYQRIRDMALEWVIHYAFSGVVLPILVGVGLWKTLGAENEAKGSESVVVNEGTMEDENTRALQLLKDLLENKDKKIKGLQNDNKRQKEQIEDMRKEHDQLKAAVKALEKALSQKE